jgi:hypothetical protein
MYLSVPMSCGMHEPTPGSAGDSVNGNSWVVVGGSE